MYDEKYANESNVGEETTQSIHCSVLVYKTSISRIDSNVSCGNGFNYSACLFHYHLYCKVHSNRTVAVTVCSIVYGSVYGIRITLP